MASEADKNKNAAGSRPRRRTTNIATVPDTKPRGGRFRRGRAAQKEAEEAALVVGKGRATPSRRNTEEEEEKAKGGNAVARFIYGMREYFQGVGSEIQKVSWPSREDTQRLSIIVVLTLIATALVLGAIAAVFTEMFRLGLSNPIILIVFMVVAVGGGLFIARLNARRSGL
ncbi:MAG: preprotein translocase subunit SecE [Chloroflexota bacterium]|nr:preprotein translocase subunit SecE [Chloroflexota bacterium]